MQDIAVAKILIDFYSRGSGNCEPSCLYIHRIVERRVVPIQINGSAGGGLQFLRSSNVIDVGMRNDNRFHF